ncbi:MAG: hypothetical protein EBT55_02355 [Proteobacteria bacterium]|nr:hypothetical protein [Pseudomonadota bacterium]
MTIKNSEQSIKCLTSIRENLYLITFLKNELQKIIVEDVVKKKEYYDLTDTRLIEIINLLKRV